MIGAFCQGVSDLREIYQSFLSPETFVALGTGARQHHDDFHVPDGLWVRVIYEFASAWHHRSLDREHLLQSLVPLYLGRTASFVLEVRESTATEVEERIERLCAVFEIEKSYLAQRWRSAAQEEETHAGTR